MKVYFLSSRPCALKINGVFLGMVDGFERFTELFPRDMPFCELIPDRGDLLPIVFTLTEKITDAPPCGTTVYLLPDGLAIYADKFICANPALRLIESKTLTAGTLTVFLQGCPQVVFEREGNSVLTALDERFSECIVHTFPKITVLSGKDVLCALDGAGTPFFCGEAKQWEYNRENDELRFITPLNDFCARTAACVWACAGENPYLANCTLSAPRELPKKFILCAALQNLLLGADVKDFFTEEVYGSLENLKTFLGAYTAVCVATQYPFGAGAVYRKGDGVYEIKYYSAETENGKITNIKQER